MRRRPARRSRSRRRATRCSSAAGSPRSRCAPARGGGWAYRPLRRKSYRAPPELPFHGRAPEARPHRVWQVPRNVADHAGIARRGRGAESGRAARVGRDDGSVHSAAAGGAAGYACRRAGSGSARRARAAGVRRVMVRLPGLQEAQRAARGFLRPVRAKVGLHPLGRPIGQYVASGRSQLSARRIPRRRELRHDRRGAGDG